MAPIGYNFADRAFGYDRADFPPTADAPRPVAVQDYRAGGVQRPDVLDRRAIPAVPDRPAAAAVGTFPPAVTQRQTSAPVEPGMTSGLERTSVTADPLRYVKTETSPLAEEARQTIDQLQRQKQHSTQWESGQDADNWLAVCDYFNIAEFNNN